MRCQVVNVEGGTAIVCGRGGRAPQCADCFRESVALCDFPITPGKTCDRRMCRIHRQRVGLNVDYCTIHRNNQPVQLPLGEVR